MTPSLFATQSATPVAKPTEHVLGTITAIDVSAQTITVKDDKSGAETVVAVANTHTLLKVAPGAKDLKQAVRISASELAIGDRVDARGSKPDPASTSIEARSVVLMSAGDLAQKHQAEMQVWQTSTAATVSAVDPASQTITVTRRAGGQLKTITVHASPTTQFTRYSPATPKTAVPSQISEIQPGDQVHVIGTKDENGDVMTGQQIYSAPVRTVIATVTSISPDGKQIVAKNLQSKQPVTIQLADDSAIRKLSPEMAAMLARSFNPAARTEGTAATAGAATAPGSQGHWQSGAQGAQQPGQPGAQRAGDLSRMLDRVPTIGAADLKPGDAIVVWGLAAQNGSNVAAHTVLAGVEPVLRAAPPRQGQSLNADWNLDMSVPAQ